MGKQTSASAVCRRLSRTVHFFIHNATNVTRCVKIVGLESVSIGFDIRVLNMPIAQAF